MPQPIQFKRSVAREFDKAGITYPQDYCEGIYSTDFMIEKDGNRIALECKANVERDIEKTRAMVELLAERLRVKVRLVAPYISEHAAAFLPQATSLSELTQSFEK